MGVFPAPVSVVTALDERGVPRGLTCSAVTSLSMEPASLLVCVNRGNRSLDAIRRSGGFVVNLLRAGRGDVSDVFASRSPHKFAERRWRASPASGLPLLFGDALAFVDCELQTEITAGSHAILIGLVRASGTNLPAHGPLVYWRRAYGGWVPSPVVPDPRDPAIALREGADMSDNEITSRLLTFIQKTFLGEGAPSELDEETPLLEWGVLTSMNTAVLLTFLRDEIGVRVPPDRINGKNFKSIRAIAEMVTELRIAADTPANR
jgi:flavin reductase (DIM6/NTAB) family NADH-FMN oxidoreductase RutF/acyl carrier protein